MRLVQVTIPDGRQDAILSRLDEEGVDYVVTEETSGREYDAIVYFPLPTNAVEDIIDALHEAGLSDDAYTVVIDAETVVSERFEELKKRFAESEESEDRVARQELVARAENLSPNLLTYAVLTVVSAVVATAGVLLDSPAVVVGSMVIAPLIGPAMTTSVGTVLNDRELFSRGVRLQVLGGILAVIAATAFAWLVKVAYLVPPGLDIFALQQLQGRVSPGFLSLAVALGAGVAGAFSLAAPVSASLVGVAIAIALIPPTAVIGIGVAWGRPLVAAGALVLVLVNMFSINFAAIGVLWYQGYRPGKWFQFAGARRTTIRRLATLAAGLALLSVFLGGVTYYSVQTASFEQQARGEVEAALAEPDYDRAVLLDFEVQYEERLPVNRPAGVVVTVGAEQGELPGLADRIDRRIRESTGRDVDVEVRFVGVQRS